jgi:hypothetical protein
VPLLLPAVESGLEFGNKSLSRRPTTCASHQGARRDDTDDPQESIYHGSVSRSAKMPLSLARVRGNYSCIMCSRQQKSMGGQTHGDVATEYLTASKC